MMILSTIGKDEFYLALTLDWKTRRQILERVLEHRQAGGDRRKHISAPKMYHCLGELVDERLAEQKIVEDAIDEVPIKRHYYRLTRGGYNERSRLLEQWRRGASGLETALAPT